MACNPSTLLSSGAAFQQLSQRDQEIVIAQLLCDISQTAAGGSGTVAFVSSPTDPNGSLTATRPALCYDDAGNVWVKTNAGSSNTGWNKIISAQSASAPQATATTEEAGWKVEIVPARAARLSVGPLRVPTLETALVKLPQKRSAFSKAMGRLSSFLFSLFT